MSSPALYMPKKVSHVRVLKEAIRLLIEIEPRNAEHEEQIANSITELEDFIILLDK